MNEYVNTAIVMIQKLIAVATPIAKQAYEISLLTLQIDAGSTLFRAVTTVIIGCFLLYIAYRIAKWDLLNNEDEKVGPQGMATTFLGGPIGIGGLILICVNAAMLLEVWLWVKLFKPELWLVHMAIEKIVK